MLIYCFVLALTVSLELLVARLWLMFDSSDQDMRSALQVVVGINLITHPLAWGVFVLVPANWMVVELIVMMVEALALWSLPGRNLRWAACLSTVMNGASLNSGLILT